MLITKKCRNTSIFIQLTAWSLEWIKKSCTNK